MAQNIPQSYLYYIKLHHLVLYYIQSEKTIWFISKKILLYTFDRFYDDFTEQMLVNFANLLVKINNFFVNMREFT